MDTVAMNMAISAMGGAMQTTTTATNDGLSQQGIDFASILAAMGGTGDGTDALSGLTTTDPTALMYMALLGNGNGTNWQDLQNTLMLDALKSLSESEKPLVTDPALSQLLQLLQNLGQSDGAGEADILDVIERLQKRLQEIMDANGGQMAGQELLAVMAALNGGDASGVQQMPNEAAAVLLEQALGTDAKGLAQMLMGESAPVMQPEAAEAFVLEAEPVSQPQQAQGTDTALPFEAEVLSAPEDQKPLDIVPAGERFAGMVREVRSQMDQQAKAEGPVAEAEKPDVDTLQGQVDAGTHLQQAPIAEGRFTQTLAQAAAEQPQPVATQISEGLAGQLASGEEQISIKLQPEELGEVTLNLTKTAEGMRLDLVAKNPETQRMLESQIELLRDSLRPMKVEVDAVRTETQQEMLSWQQQGFTQHRHSQTPMHGAAYYRDEPLGTEAIVAPGQAQAMAPTAALDTYI